MNNHLKNDSKKIMVLGGGESGVGAALLAAKHGYEVFLSDNCKLRNKYKNVLLNNEIRFEEGKHTYNLISKADLVIKSPGIPDNIKIIESLKSRTIPIISEIEFAGWFTKAKKICITGANGKTTTASLTHHILKKAGLNAGLAGNVGQSFAWQVAEKNYDYYVLEISSFQLDGMFDFRADISILLNITPDHLDRYENDFQKYIDSKFRITRNQTSEDAFIFCLDDKVIMNEIAKREINTKKYPFSIKEVITDQGACLTDNQIIIITKSSTINMTLEKLALQGKHNIYNSMAAGIAARVLDIRKDIIKESLSDFQNIEHRLEYVTKVHGIEFINDSKATNVNSTWYALECIIQPIVWIVGGIDKGNDYKVLKDLVKSKVKAIVCLGLDNSKIINAFKDVVEIILETKTAEEAVNTSYYLGQHGDTVLLSPACASFDLFENYEDRGRQFKMAVKEL
ncbi:UDP-N-acetylmuramoyl-L-alanine--D-glutamate ligase [Bacteroidota bacterium]